METFKKTPLGLFNMPQHFVIPLFQRPYVWKETEQWEPLWGDVRRIAELRISEPYLNPYHFLGAVVLQAQESEIGGIQKWNVIDGQQRLTTLQILADATCAVFTDLELRNLAAQLEVLIHNGEQFIPEGSTTLKMRHLNKDRDAYDEVMTAEPPIDYTELHHANSQLARAHEYFTTVVTEWLGAKDSHGFMDRATQLAHVLLEDLHLVAIQLTAEENSQEIFETLNARGTPLTAADLIRNFVFQRLELEYGDTSKAYEKHWPFEESFWSESDKVGRFNLTRSSMFFNQWLVAKVGEEISPQSTFTRFKTYIEHETDMKMADLLPLIQQQAKMYEDWTKAARKHQGDLSPVEMTNYRMETSGTLVAKSILIWLHDPERKLPQQVINEVVNIIESWIVRRQILRLPSSSMTRVFADLIATHKNTPAEELSGRVQSFFTRQNASGTYWPGDAEVRESLVNEPVYRRLPRARLRFILEAIEDHYRAQTGQAQIERAKLPIEHLMPRKWEDHWPLNDSDESTLRNRRVHRLGNLSLLTASLNSRVSNNSWEIKRQELLKHNTVNLTGRVIHMTEDRPWDDAFIDERTRELAEVVLKIWPVPEGHVGEIIDPQAHSNDSIQLPQLVSAGYVTPGTILRAKRRGFHGIEATVNADGSLTMNGKRFQSPSGAACSVRGGAANGWHFWVMPDGRRLREVRNEYLDYIIHKGTTD